MTFTVFIIVIINILNVSFFRLEFESHCARLNTQLEYDQNHLEQQNLKLCKMEESIKKEESIMAEKKEVSISGGHSLLVDCKSSTFCYMDKWCGKMQA